MAEYIVRMEPEHPEFQVLIGALLRCRDCRFRTDEEDAKQGITPGYCCVWESNTEDNGYCYMGEPKEA